MLTAAVAEAIARDLPEAVLIRVPDATHSLCIVPTFTDKVARELRRKFSFLFSRSPTYAVEIFN